MTIEFMRPEVDELKPRISVIGVGGAGGNAIANMINSDVQGVDFIVANTDAQALNNSAAERRIQLGLEITQGLGAGSKPEIGRAAAEETIEEVEKALEGAHMCFIAAGMGGGTGTGAAPVIAKAARERGILTVGVVTKPFNFEGNRRAKSADAGIEELQKHVDTLIVIPNQNLFLVANPNTTFREAFKMADEVLQQGVRGITDLMVMPGLINLDFADVRSVMGEMGKAMMGTGESSGDNRAIEAAERARRAPSKAKGLVHTPTVRMPRSRAALAMTGAAPVPVPPPMPAAMKHMCAPSSAAMISSSVSSAAARPISGRDPAPSPWVILRPSWMRRSASEALRACASVLATTKSTPWTSARIMLAMALPPAPPTPITLMRGRSSSTSGRMKSMLMSPNLPQTAQRVEPSR
jgi:cell division protein FtsZ